jgi:hypothetical protein
MEVTYKGRTMCCDDFRTWIYGKNDTKKLVNSWSEYEDHINGGEWYSTKEEAEATPKQEEVVVIKPKGRKKGGK